MTTPAAALEGVLRARLCVEGGMIRSALVAPRPTPPIKSLLKGRKLAEAVRLLPRLFSLCGMAQTVAALQAAEMALALPVSAAQVAARLAFTLAETVQEHATRLLLDAPLALGEAPDAQAAKTIRRHVAGLVPLVCANDAWVKPGGGQLDPDRKGLAEWLETLRRLVLTHLMAGCDVAGLTQASELERWAKQGGSTAALGMARIFKDQQARLGASATFLMGRLDLEFVRSALASEGGLDFASAPRNADGFCLETGPLSRQYENPLIKDLHRHYGYGLAARYAARLIELSHAVTGIALSLPLLDAEGASNDDPAGGDGEGLGSAEAARGRLFHWLRLRDGLVDDYRPLAPTEWNFHPDGAFAQGLKAVAAKDDEAVLRAAKLHGLALDPCVLLEIEVDYA